MAEYPQTAASVSAELKALADPERAKNSARFFKTGPGQYGEGDVFIGVTVPEQRQVAKRHAHLPLSEVEKLLGSKIHEVRLTALIILVSQYRRGGQTEQELIYDFYLAHSRCVDNWDLVDSSASYIVGSHLQNSDRAILYELARSENIWERRIAIIATAHFIAQRESKDTFAIAEILLTDTHDLIHKAVGWMLREVGKSCGQEVLELFLRAHYHDMPRTMLRYAIEKFPESLRQQYLKGQV